MDQAGGFLLRHASQIRNSMVNLANLQPPASSQWPDYRSVPVSPLSAGFIR